MNAKARNSPFMMWGKNHNRSGIFDQMTLSSPQGIFSFLPSRVSIAPEKLRETDSGVLIRFSLCGFTLRKKLDVGQQEISSLKESLCIERELSSKRFADLESQISKLRQYDPETLAKGATAERLEREFKQLPDDVRRLESKKLKYEKALRAIVTDRDEAIVSKENSVTDLTARLKSFESLNDLIPHHLNSTIQVFEGKNSKAVN